MDTTVRSYRTAVNGKSAQYFTRMRIFRLTVVRGSRTVRPMKVSDIIEKLGGVRPTSREMEVGASTVQDWRRANCVPPKHARKFLKLCSDRKLRITADDLLPPEQTQAAE